MSHRSFQETLGTPFHLVWNSEPVHLTTEDGEEVAAVVDLGLPVNDYDRGEGIIGRGQLIVDDAKVIPYGTAIWIRDEQWEYDKTRKPEDGNRMVFVVRRDPSRGAVLWRSLMAGFGSLYQPYLILERMLSQCTSFQSLTGAADATAALAFIKFISCQDRVVDPETNAEVFTADPYPRATIWNVNPNKKKSSTSTYSIQPRMLLSIDIEIPDGIEATENMEFRYCGPIYEAIEDEMASKAGNFVPGNLDFTEINYLQVPSPLDVKFNQGRRLWGCEMEFVCQG